MVSAMRDRSVHVVVVRHGCAGDKQTWLADDFERPLDEGGIRQAQALAQALAAGPVERLVASPTRRCTQTLEPLAIRLRLAIESFDVLRPDGSILDVLDAEWQAFDGVVMCTHGELMQPLLAAVKEHDVRIVAQPGDDEWLLTKGSAWHLTFNADGNIVQLRHEAPLPLPGCAAHALSD